MKKHLTLQGLLLAGMLGAALTAAAQQQPAKKKTAHLHGTLKNFYNQVEIEDMSAYQYLLPPDAGRVVVADENGHFDIRMALDTPGYYHLGRNQLYLSPGDDMEMVIDKNNSALADFSGKGSAANRYLRGTPFPKGGSFLEAGKNVAATPEATLDGLLAKASGRQQQLDTLQQVTAVFKRLEKARTEADIIVSLNALNIYGVRRGGDTAKLFLARFNELAAPVKERYAATLRDPSFMQLVAYRDIADKLPGMESVPAVKDWYTASDLVRDMQKESDKTKLQAFRARIAAIGSTGYRRALEKSLDNLLKFGKGDLASDFTATDSSGNKIALSSLRGKVIYVDLWATWCGPCMAEMPSFVKLKEKYKDNPNVAFVSVSIDDDAGQWRRSLVRHHSDGYQWLINRDKLSAYNIVGIPRTLLIDKQFNMVEMNGALPSSPQAEKSIEALLK
ncbi:MAG: redoxin family protein [Bacteroidetes bacterium]|nr:redoxin family protein [Bacteroidota bacterium]